jgi:bacterioferritin (cytochrome b1)
MLSASQPKTSYSCGPCASRTTTSKSKKEIVEAKHQRVTVQAKVRQMIQDEEQRARELEQEIALMQGEGQYNL